MFRQTILPVVIMLAAGLTCAQQATVKVNVLNVCAPSAEEQKELLAALAKLPLQPAFASDFEVSRGRSTLDENSSLLATQPLPSGTKSTANWVRMRREFPASSPFSNVQYSFSVDEANMVETLVLRVRDPKDVLQVSLEDSAPAATSPATMLRSNTPVSRIKLERFGKSSVVLARCSGTQGSSTPDQSAYEPIFRSASAMMSRYRDALGIRRTVPQELARLGIARATPPTNK